MAYIRPCRDCGQRISMREMRAGQWVAFDASTETPHRCGKITKADPNIKKLAKEKIKEQDSEGIDLGYSDIEEQNSPTNQVDEANEKIEEAKSSSYYEELKKYQFRNNDTKQTPWIDERAKVPEGTEPVKNTYFEKETVESYKNRIKNESKYKPRDFWWYFWRAVVVFWVLMLLNGLLFGPFD